MLNFENIYLVRHGSYTGPPQRLTEKGKEQSRLAGKHLSSAGIKIGATLLSSDAPRALQTAAIIASIIGTEVVPSKRINIIGNDPYGVEYLDEMLEAALAEAGRDTSGGNLVVVTHEPLLAIVAPRVAIANGKVVEYQPETWQNPEFNLTEQEILTEQLKRADLS